jgi:predicted O-methyltransferase YrrM
LTEGRGAMFYNPENSRGWIVETVYANDPASKILDQMHNDPEAPGESDIGIRNLLYTMILNLRPRRVLEIGCHIGSGAIVIGAALPGTAIPG